MTPLVPGLNYGHGNHSVLVVSPDRSMLQLSPLWAIWAGLCCCEAVCLLVALRGVKTDERMRSTSPMSLSLATPPPQQVKCGWVE